MDKSQENLVKVSATWQKIQSGLWKPIETHWNQVNLGKLIQTKYTSMKLGKTR